MNIFVNMNLNLESFKILLQNWFERFQKITNTLYFHDNSSATEQAKPRRMIPVKLWQ